MAVGVVELIWSVVPCAVDRAAGGLQLAVGARAGVAYDAQGRGRHPPVGVEALGAEEIDRGRPALMSSRLVHEPPVVELSV